MISDTFDKKKSPHSCKEGFGHQDERVFRSLIIFKSLVESLVRRSAKEKIEAERNIYPPEAILEAVFIIKGELSN